MQVPDSNRDLTVALKIRSLAQQLAQVNTDVRLKHLNELGENLTQLVNQLHCFESDPSPPPVVGPLRLTPTFPCNSSVSVSNGTSQSLKGVIPPLHASRSTFTRAQTLTLAPYLTLTSSPRKLASGSSGGSDQPAKPLRARLKRNVSLTMNDLIPASLYVAFEGIVASLKAEKGSIYMPLPGTDQLAAVVLVGFGSTLPSQVRVGITSSHLGSVFSSGIATNIQKVAHERVSNMNSVGSPRLLRAPSSTIVPSLIFPLRCFELAHQTIGVVQVQNKQMGSVDFTAQDEELLFARLPILSYILSRYPYDHFQVHFDPSHIHCSVPWQPAQPTTEGLLPPLFDQHVIPQMLHRSVDTNTSLHHNSLSNPSRDDASSALITIGMTPTLREIASYLNNLQDSWRHGVHTLVELEKKQDDKTELIRSLREELRHMKAENTRLTEQVRIHTATSADYVHEYAKLEKELASLLMLRTQASGGAHPVLPSSTDVGVK